MTTDIIRSDREGILIDGHDPDHYAQALLRLLEDPAQAGVMGKAARERVEMEFGLERIAGRYAKLFGELCGVPLEFDTKTEISV